MRMFFFIVVLCVIGQRLIELRIANRNTAYMLDKGGYEVGREHYRYVIWLHVLFFVSLIGEATFHYRPARWWWLPFGLFLAAQLGRYWCIRSLGRFWNTRIIVLPNHSPITRGPYRFLRHPNYWIVGLELFLLPLSFSAYMTAFVFPLLHLWFLMRFRLPLEEQSLY